MQWHAAPIQAFNVLLPQALLCPEQRRSDRLSDDSRASGRGPFLLFPALSYLLHACMRARRTSTHANLLRNNYVHYSAIETSEQKAREFGRVPLWNRCCLVASLVQLCHASMRRRGAKMERAISLDRLVVRKGPSYSSPKVGWLNLGKAVFVVEEETWENGTVRSRVAQESSPRGIAVDHIGWVTSSKRGIYGPESKLKRINDEDDEQNRHIRSANWCACQPTWASQLRAHEASFDRARLQPQGLVMSSHNLISSTSPPRSSSLASFLASFLAHTHTPCGRAHTPQAF